MTRIKKAWSVEQRWPTKKARDAADEAIDALPAHDPMSAYIDVWLRVYAEHGGIERRPT